MSDDRVIVIDTISSHTRCDCGAYRDPRNQCPRCGR